MRLMFSIFVVTYVKTDRRISVTVTRNAWTENVTIANLVLVLLKHLIVDTLINNLFFARLCVILLPTAM